ncbi:MAG: hypothetical protein EBX50_19755 [Chitinophagia bacterium]|jgi:uncharacterized membrane protein|nr:hypothetical protein [Chitinophagia bacterium]
MINILSTHWIVFAGIALLILGVVLYLRRMMNKKSQLAYIALDAQLSNALQTLRLSITKYHSRE